MTKEPCSTKNIKLQNFYKVKKKKLTFETHFSTIPATISSPSFFFFIVDHHCLATMTTSHPPSPSSTMKYPMD